MRILVIGKFYVEGFALHIAETLAAMGHEVSRYEPGVKYNSLGGLVSKRWRQIKSVLYELSQHLHVTQEMRKRRLLRIARENVPKLTVVCHDFLTPREVRKLKEVTGGPVVLWFPDALTSFGRSYFLNSGYDALFFKDPYIVHVLKRTLNLPIYYLPECFNPASLTEVQIRAEDEKCYGCDIVTAGNMYPYRGAFFKQLKGYSVRIWGNPAPLWMDVSGLEGMMQNRFVADADKAKAFRAAKIIVNSLHPAEVWGLNARAFEIAGAGGFQLVDWRPGLEQLFVDGKEIVSFSSMADLKEKVGFYLREDGLRKEIADRGRQRALRDHTYEKRLILLLDTVSGNSKGFPMPELGEGQICR